MASSGKEGDLYAKEVKKHVRSLPILEDLRNFDAEVRISM
jgi:hypothetical protein